MKSFLCCFSFKKSVLARFLIFIFSILPGVIFSQAPTITSYTPNQICTGDQITIIGTNFNNVSAVNIVGSTATFVINNSSSITATANSAGTGNISVTNPVGTTPSTGTVTVLQAPSPILNDVTNSSDPFTNCDGNSTYTITVSNSSTCAGNCTYSINWGDGPSQSLPQNWPSGAQISHTYNSQGYFNIVLTITSSNGCTRTKTYSFYNGTNPIASLSTSTSTTGLCAPASIQFQIGNWFGNSTGTTYQLNYGDLTTPITLTHPLNSTNTLYLISHIYTTSSCPTTDYTATLKAINGCFTTTYTLNQIVIRKKPIPNFTANPNPVCLGIPVCFTNTTIAGYSGNSCSNTSTYEWDFGDGSPRSNLQTPPCHLYASVGTYTVTLKASNNACGDSSISKTVTVSPLPSPPTVTTPVSYCQNQTASPLSASGTGLLWYTSLTGVGSATPITPSTITAGIYTYYVTQTINGCESPKASITVTINVVPPMPTVTSPVQYCQNQTASLLTAIGTNLLWYTSSTGGTGSTTAPTLSTANIGTTTYYVSQSSNGCEGPRASINVIINSLASAPTVTSPVNYCQNDVATPLTASGSSLLWYSVASGGTSNTAAPTPSTATVGSTSYYVSQLTGCGESPRSTIVVNVSIRPTATISYSPTNLCNVINSANTPNPTINVTFSGTSGGTYSVSPSTGLLINSTTGEINPSGATAGTYTITYTISSSGSCPSVTATATVTVNGTPTALISYPTFCPSDNAANVVLTGSTGGNYTSTPGLTINNLTGTINPTTSTPGSYVVTYTISPSLPCPGFSTSTNVTIIQPPTATISYSSTNLCNVTNSSTTPNPPINVTFSGTSGGTYSIAPSTGLPINSTTGEINPSGATAGTYTITYTINISGSCPPVTATATVIVNGTPSASISYPSICSSDIAANVILTGSAGGNYTSTSGLTINSLTGTINPSTSNPGSYVVTYTISPTLPCPRFTTTTTIIITQAPTATISYPVSNLCNVLNSGTNPNPLINVGLTGTTGGVFSISLSTGLSINGSTGQLSPSGATSGTYTITYTIAAAGGCQVFSTTTNVSVSAAPTASINYPTAICTSDPITAPVITGSTGGNFSSTTGLVINIITGSINPGASTPGTYVVNYNISPTPPCPGFTTTTNVIITQAPSATISYPVSNLCNVANTGTTPNPPVSVNLSGTTGGTYSVLPATGLTINSTTGQISPSGANSGLYVITYTIPGAGGCLNFSTTTNITIIDAPTATINYPGSPFCGGLSVPQPVTLTGISNGIFSSNTGLSINQSTGAINPSLSIPGNFIVTYTIAASPPCPGFTTTSSVTINESPTVTFTDTLRTICSGDTLVYLPVSSVPGTVYNWTVVGSLPSGVSGNLAGTTLSTDTSISMTYTNTGTTSQTISFEVIPVNPTSNPCNGISIYLTAIINPIPTAPIVTDTVDYCLGTPGAPLTAIAQPGNQLLWYDGNLNPLPSAPTPATNAPLQFIYYVSQISGQCESPKSKITAIVYPTPKIISSSFTNPTSCGLPTGSITLNILDLNNNPIPNRTVMVYYKKFQTNYVIPDTTDASGNITMSLTAGTYTDFYIEINGCFSNRIPDIFLLRDPTPPAIPTAGYNPPVCSEKILNLSASSATSNVSGPVYYVWVGPAFGNQPDTTINTVFSFPSASINFAGTYIVYAIQNNCISPDTSFEVIIKQSPTKPIITTINPLCIGDNLNLQSVSSLPNGTPNATLLYTWNGPGRGFPINTANAEINNVIIQDEGIYTITVYSPSTGCSSQTDTLIRIGGYPIVSINAGNELVLPTGQILVLSSTIVNASDPHILPIKLYEWSPNSNIQCNDPICSAPLATIKNDVCYSVNATNIYGCNGRDTICVKVFCENTQVYIPNAFTPNGDGANDILLVRGKGIAKVKSFRIFNRWGEIVFERNDFPPNDSHYGWDGRIKGIVGEPAVYVYTAEAVCENGSIFFYKGNTTILK